MIVECYYCGGDCSHAHATYNGWPCHVGCIPAPRKKPAPVVEDAIVNAIKKERGDD